MADLAEKLLAKTAKEYETILKLNKTDPASYLRKHSAASLLQGVKIFHDSIHTFEAQGKSQFISELVIQGLEDEQVWQQQELQLDAAKRFIHEKFSITNIENLPLCLELVKNHSPAVINKENTHGIGKDKVGDDDDDVNDDDDDITMSDANDSEPSDEDSDSDPELSRIKKAIKKSGSSDCDDSGDEELFKGAEDEWALEDDDNENDENDFDFDLPAAEKKVNNKKCEVSTAKPKPPQRKTEVDDRFFKLADMEQFLEQEDRKEERKHKPLEGNDESDDESKDAETNIDYFATWSNEEEGQDAMYADFFDPPEGEQGDMQQKLFHASDQDSEEEDEEDMETDEEGEQPGKKKVRFSQNTKSASDDEEDEQKPLSNFEKRSERLRQHIERLEEQSLEPRQWQMTGEVGAGDRPENSMLEEHVEFKQAPLATLEITEEVTQSIEELIVQRIKDKSFDDNKRQVRPRDEAFELKTERTLEQEKSKLSLHEVYEQEYLKLQAPEEKKRNPAHDQIKKMMDFLFPRLDALASWHYTPLKAVGEVKVQNNMPAIKMEEATPITMTTATMLAPEEVQARKKGDLKGKTERTKEDKLRERKKKKAAKRDKMKEKEKHQKEVEKLNPGLGNKYSKERALKELEKQARGNIEVIKEKKSQKKVSSKAFFDQLQQEVSSQIKAKTTIKTAHKKKHKSSDKLLL